MDSGKYLLLGISVTPLSLDLPLLVLLDKVPLDIDGDGGAGEHRATVMAPPDRLRLFEHETGPTKHWVAVAGGGQHHLPLPLPGLQTIGFEVGVASDAPPQPWRDGTPFQS